MGRVILISDSALMAKATFLLTVQRNVDMEVRVLHSGKILDAFGAVNGMPEFASRFRSRFDS